MTNKELVYLKIGMIINVSQTIEYNLSNVIAFYKLINDMNKKKIYTADYKDFVNQVEQEYDELSRKPMGNVLEEVKNTNLFDEDLLKKLSKVLHKRNYYAHRFFKDDFKKNDINNNPETFLDELDYTLKLFQEMNNYLADVFKKEKEKFKSLHNDFKFKI